MGGKAPLRPCGTWERSRSFDRQIRCRVWKTFHQCGKEPVQAKTGSHLIELLRDPHIAVITTLLQKFGAAAKDSKQFRVDDDNLFVLVDESHRSQYGEANIQMQKSPQSSMMIMRHSAILVLGWSPGRWQEKDGFQRSAKACRE